MLSTGDWKFSYYGYLNDDIQSYLESSNKIFLFQLHHYL